MWKYRCQWQYWWNISISSLDHYGYRHLSWLSFLLNGNIQPFSMKILILTDKYSGELQRSFVKLYSKLNPNVRIVSLFIPPEESRFFFTNWEKYYSFLRLPSWILTPISIIISIFRIGDIVRLSGGNFSRMSVKGGVISIT